MQLVGKGGHLLDLRKAMRDSFQWIMNHTNECKDCHIALFESEPATDIANGIVAAVGMCNQGQARILLFAHLMLLRMTAEETEPDAI